MADQLQQPDFWSAQQKAAKVSQKLNNINKTLEEWKSLKGEFQEIEQLLRLNEEERDKKIDEDIKNRYFVLTKKLKEFRLKTFLSGKYDDHNCLLSVHAGAGGTDAQDWAEMLMRMYIRYCEGYDLTAEVLDKSTGGEAGIKSAVLHISGSYAYGYLKSEAGVHRLIRLSPYNPAHTRETSFALVEVLPELEEHEEMTLDPKDLKIETSTSRGSGGQSVNTTYSAIRITHIPTGLKVSIQNERSQQQNKAKALKILQGKLKVLEEEEKQKEKLKIRGEFHSAEWGNQIRSYTLHPYKLVKDHRTGHEVSDAEGVLEGDLDGFISSYLESLKKTRYDRR